MMTDTAATSMPTPTSEAADASDRRHATVLRDMVFQCIKDAGLEGVTDEQIQDKLKMQGNTARPRRWELSHKEGRIRKDVTDTRKTRSGRKAAVWIALDVPVPPVQAEPASQWTEDYPTEAGRYWFYGSAYSLTGEYELRTIVVQRSGEKVFYVAEGAFMYKQHSRGVFMPMDLPELPEEA